jgi:hypothetical protein
MTLLISIIIATVIMALTAVGDVLTYHDDNSRTGVAADTALTTKNVTALTFGKKFDLAVDGQVYAQPLVISNIVVRGILHNLLLVATEADSVYAFDAFSGALLWHTSLLANGEVPAGSINCTDLTPENGITSTPVIDPALQEVFVLGMCRTVAGTNIEKLYALDLSTGNHVRSIVIAAQFPGSFPAPDVVGGKIHWIATQERQRAALLLLNGVIYTAYGSFCDRGYYAGWVIAYNASTLAQVGVFNDNPTAAGTAAGTLNPNGSGGGIWGAGSGLAANSTQLFATTGNGPFDGLTTFGDCVLRLSPTCKLNEFFVPPEQLSDQQHDTDLGSGGLVLLSQGGLQLGVVAGKSGTIYLVDSTNLRSIYQTLKPTTFGPIYGVPAYYNGALYYGPSGKPLVKLVFVNGKLVATPAALSSTSFPFPGTVPSIANGVVFTIKHNSNSTVLYAYDATDLRELYNSTQNTTLEAGTKFAVPTIYNQMVFVGTTHHVSIFSLK